jgi:hypothetical protein
MSARIDRLSEFVAECSGNLYLRLLCDDAKRAVLGCARSCDAAVLSDALLLALECKFYFFGLCIGTQQLLDGRLFALVMMWLETPNARRLALALEEGSHAIDCRLLAQVADADRLSVFSFSSVLDSSQTDLYGLLERWFATSTSLRRVNLDEIWPSSGFENTCLPMLRTLERNTMLTSIGLGVRLAPGNSGAAIHAFLEETTLPIDTICVDVFDYGDTERCLRCLRRFELCDLGVRTTYVPLESNSVAELLALIQIQSNLRSLTLDPICCTEPAARAALICCVATYCTQLRSFACSAPIWDKSSDTATSNAIVSLIASAPSTLSELDIGSWQFGAETSAALADALLENYAIQRLRVCRDLAQVPLLQRLLVRNQTAAHWPSTRSALLAIASGLASLAWPPYVVLDIVDSMARFHSTRHSRKIAVLVCVQRAAAAVAKE